MVIFAMQTDGRGRLGVTATRKIGNAVARARGKRRLREVYRRRPPGVNRVGIDLVINARRSCLDAPWDALVEDFDDCLSRVVTRMAAERR